MGHTLDRAVRRCAGTQLQELALERVGLQMLAPVAGRDDLLLELDALTVRARSPHGIALQLPNRLERLLHDGVAMIGPDGLKLYDVAGVREPRTARVIGVLQSQVRSVRTAPLERDGARWAVEGGRCGHH